MPDSALRSRRGRPIPVVLLVPAVVGLAFIVLPGLALVVRAPWSELGQAAREGSLWTALRLSLVSSVLATVAALLLGVPLGWVLARIAFRGRAIVRGVAFLPLALPPVVAGLALLLVFGRRGFLGPTLESVGIVLPFTLGAAVMAQTFVALPFVIVAVEAGVRAVDDRLEDVAATLGASPLTTTLRVTFPLAAPAIGAGAALAWARALGEFGATVIFAGSVEGRTQTLPLAVFEVLQRDREAAVLLAVVLVALALAVIVVFRGALVPRRESS